MIVVHLKQNGTAIILSQSAIGHIVPINSGDKGSTLHMTGYPPERSEIAVTEPFDFFLNKFTLKLK
jgi:hypothetical protein